MEVWYSVDPAGPGTFDPGEIVEYTYADHSTLGTTEPVMVCRGGSVVEGDTWGDCDGSLLWVSRSLMEAGDLVGGTGQLYALASLGWSEGGGGGDDPDGFDIGDIDPSQAGGFFSVGFSIVATSWALGKAVSVLLRQLR